MDGLTAIPVEVPSQIALRDFLKNHFDTDSDMMNGIRLGAFYCHYGELIKRRRGDVEISNVGIPNTEFEQKMFDLLEDVPQEVLDFINQEN